MRIVVLAGGLSPERNVSLSTATMVTRALRELGHQAGLVDLFFGLEAYQGDVADFFVAPLDLDGAKISQQAPDLAQIRAQRRDKSASLIGPGVLELCRQADCVFLALHGCCGEDGRLQGALDLMGIPYTGSGALPSAIAMDKDLTKRMVEKIVPTPPWRKVEYTREEIPAVMAGCSLPVVVKPLDSGSSIGVAIARRAEELQAALEENLALGGRVVLEQYIVGREIQVGILEGQALPSIEIITENGFYDYANKYQPGAAREVCPAEIPPALEEQLRRGAVAVFEALHLQVYARADFIVDARGTPWFLEINTLPGMTPTSLLPQEAAAAGISYTQLCHRILTASLQARG